jgi:hypothetical protein
LVLSLSLSLSLKERSSQYGLGMWTLDRWFSNNQITVLTTHRAVLSFPKKELVLTVL